MVANKAKILMGKVKAWAIKIAANLIAAIEVAF